MTRTLGKHQLAMLATIASPNIAIVVADERTRSICRRGLARELKPGAFVAITAAGLRALADAMDDGRYEGLTQKKLDAMGKPGAHT